MIKTIRFWQKRADLSSSEFKWRWLTKNALVQGQAVRYSPIQRVTVSFPGPRQIENHAAGHSSALPIDFDAIEATYFSTMDELNASLADGVVAALEEDALTFATPHPDLAWTVTLDELMGERREAYTSVTGLGDLKTLRTMARRSDMDRTQLRIYWHNNHKVIEEAVPFNFGRGVRIVVGFNTGHTIAKGELQPADDQHPHRIDAFQEHYFPAGSQPWRWYEEQERPPEIERDESHFMDMTLPYRRAILEEYVVADKLVDTKSR